MYYMIRRIFPCFLFMATMLFASCAAGGEKEQKPAEQPAEPATLVKELNTDSPDSDQFVKLVTNMGDKIGRAHV